MKPIKNQTVIFALIFLMFSCEPVEETTLEQETAPQIGDAVWESRSLNEEEINNARKFCRNLESKEIAFRREYIGRSVNFKLQYRNCDEEVLTSEITGRLTENPIDRNLEFNPSFTPIPFWRDVEGIQGSVMGDFCIDLLSNLQVTNTTIEEGLKSIFKFSALEDKLRVQIHGMGEEQNEVNILEEMTIEF